MSKIDPTLTIERMARQLRERGATNPVAGAVAQAARGAALQTVEEYAVTTQRSCGDIAAAEEGAVAFGALAPEIGPAISAVGADLMVLADLEAEWRLDESASPTGT